MFLHLERSVICFKAERVQLGDKDILVEVLNCETYSEQGYDSEELEVLWLEVEVPLHPERCSVVPKRDLLEQVDGVGAVAHKSE
jgi:hypothetical protein